MLTAEERERLHRAQGRDPQDANARARANRDLKGREREQMREEQDELFYRQFWRDVYVAAVEQGQYVHAAGWADVAVTDLKARSFK